MFSFLPVPTAQVKRPKKTVAKEEILTKLEVGCQQHL